MEHKVGLSYLAHSSGVLTKSHSITESKSRCWLWRARTHFKWRRRSKDFALASENVSSGANSVSVVHLFLSFFPIHVHSIWNCREFLFPPTSTVEQFSFRGKKESSLSQLSPLHSQMSSRIPSSLQERFILLSRPSALESSRPLLKSKQAEKFFSKRPVSSNW